MDEVIFIKKKDFFEEWCRHPKHETNSRLFEFLVSKLGSRTITKDSERELKKKIAALSAKIFDKWTASGKQRQRFFSKNEDWLEGEDLQFSVSSDESQPSTSSGIPAASVGRPRKSFDDASYKTKKRRVEDLTTTRSREELTTAAEIAMRLSGKRKIASLIKNISEGNRVEKSPPPAGRQLTSNEALAYYIDSKSTTNSYTQTRKWSLKAGHNVFPSYESIRLAKQQCCPSSEHIFISETRAEIQLQAVLNKTAERLVESQREVIINKLPNSSASFTLVSKWGCDGSSGHSTYKQKFESATATDEFLFVFSFVPLRLLDGESVLWQNPRPSSTMYCRPIKFIFAKEDNEFTRAETNKVLEEVNQLLPTLCSIGDTQISVEHKLLLTMTDGKVCNALTETKSAQKCYICGATPKMMNDEAKNFDANKDHYGFGLSTLHAWIRCFECLLHISYKLGIKKWQTRSQPEKDIVSQRTAQIKEDFKRKMSLIVDKPKPGYGNSNDGNTARRFFGNPELSAEITGLDTTLINNFDTLLRTLSSGYDINISEYEKLCNETKQLYLSLYSWYYMPVTVHKILVHSSEVIRTSLLPIGQLSEEAQESRNKDCRRFREYNTRKRSRLDTNTDLIRMLLITSDPLINGLREIPKKKADQLPSEVLRLIVPPSVPISTGVIFSKDDLTSSDEPDSSGNDESDDDP